MLDIIKALNRKFGKTILGPATEIVPLEIKRLSTGSLAVDIETGGGLPTGRLIEIFGPESTGKTALTLKIAAQTQKLNKRVLWIDAEGTLDLGWAQILGVKLDLLDVAKPETGNQAGDILDTTIRSGEYSLIVLDSVAALMPKLEEETSMDDPEKLGDVAKLVTRIMRRLTAALNTRIGEDRIPNETTIIFINQIRMKIGVAYGNPETTTGGRALRHIASVRLELRRGRNLELDQKIIGYTVKFRTVKNKTFCPLRKSEFDFYTDGDRIGQIDTVKEILTYGLLSGVIQHSGHTYSFKDNKVVGKENFLKYLDEHPDDTTLIKKQILKIYHLKGEDGAEQRRASKDVSEDSK